jgi:hypothetical protein
MAADSTDIMQQPPILKPEHKRLHVFAGRWKVVGWNRDSAPIAPGAKIIGEETYEWLTGGFFMVSRFQHHFGDDAHIGMGTMGYDADSHAYFVHNFDNLGYDRRYQVHVDNQTWKFTGETERCTLVFSHDGSRKTESWEISSDGSNWQPLCEMTAAKIG